MIDVVKFKPNHTYVSSTPPNYREFYLVTDVINNDSSIEIVTDRGSFPLSENYIHVVDHYDGNVTYVEYFEGIGRSLVIATDTYEALGFDRIDTRDRSKYFFNAYGEFVELDK